MNLFIDAMWKSVNIISLTRQLATYTYEYWFCCLVILIKSKFTVNANLLHFVHNQQHIYYRDADCSKWEVRMQSSFLHGSQNSLSLAVCVNVNAVGKQKYNRQRCKPYYCKSNYCLNCVFCYFFFSLESTW